MAFVDLEVQISKQAQYFADLEVELKGGAPALPPPFPPVRRPSWLTSLSMIMPPPRTCLRRACPWLWGTPVNAAARIRKGTQRSTLGTHP